MVTIVKKNWRILVELVRAGVSLKHEGSRLGVLWYVVSPLLFFSVLYIVFSTRLGRGVEHYELYLLLGLTLWSLFQSATTAGMRAIFTHANVIKSVHVPKELFVVAQVCKELVTHVCELAVYIGIALLVGVLPVTALLFPVLYVLYIIFTLGCSFLLASVFLVLRDLERLWPFLLRLWWFATPIFYTPPESFALWNKVNPLFYIIDAGRGLLIYGEVPSLMSWGIIGMWSMGVFGMGAIIFHVLSPRFSEFV